MRNLIRISNYEQNSLVDKKGNFLYYKEYNKENEPYVIVLYSMCMDKNGKLESDWDTYTTYGNVYTCGESPSTCKVLGSEEQYK